MASPRSIRPLPSPGASPRVVPGGLRDLGAINWGITRIAGLGMGTASPNLFATMGRNRRLFRAWLRFAGHLMPGGRLPRRDTEMVILRVAHLRRAVYEHQHHERLGRRHGIDATTLTRIHDGPDADGWSPRDRAVLRAVDSLVADGDLDDATWDALGAHLGRSDVVELVMLVSQYDALATFLGTLRIAPDDPQPLRRRLRRA
ncbi:unannotated protein [freshwater metagenome]|uniref:Unannotated protein n=1 Tax=freshwater metagenome TaxID=449393 RepID=A0A6J7FG23_9ZZZZ|nr:carboxymuconolactone decarboxylase family protein [Actinomycetota bacterium]